MNSPTLCNQALTIFGLIGASTCSAALLLIFLRGPLLTALERLRAAKRLTQLVVLLAFAFATLFGGAKHGSPTNDPPADIEGAASTNAAPPVLTASRPRLALSASPVLTASRPRLALSAPPQQPESDLLCSPSPSTFTSLAAWNTRGAYSDWQRIDFPPSFAFPHGTNLLSGVTVLAYGELRENLHCSPSPSAFTLNLPQEVSLEPDASSFAHGLTPSNSYLFAWSNVCVDRSPTNRADASVELFPSGVCSVRFGASQTDYPPAPPPGFVGSGQDTNWLASVFTSTDYSQITEKGYSAWLSEDFVGINEQNGHFRADIAVATLPDNGVPCYLVCGPYKVVVPCPGTYSFPLEVFETYKVRTYPVAMPLSISTDDGYRASLFSASSPSPVLTASRPRLAFSAPTPQPPEYEICETPRLVISPTEVPLRQAVGTHISIWCNVASAARRYSALISREFRLNFCNPSDAEIVAAEVEDLVEIIIDAPLGTCAGTITITDNDLCCGCGSCTGSDCTCGCDCWRHQASNDTPTNSPSATP